jgi:hypothetical protein
MRTTIVSCRHSTNGRKAGTPVQQNICLMSWPSPQPSVLLLMTNAEVVPHLRLDSRRRGFMMLPVVPQLALPLEVPYVFHTFVSHGGCYIPAVHRENTCFSTIHHTHALPSASTVLDSPLHAASITQDRNTSKYPQTIQVV